jgi:N-acetylglucosamine kinase-like BadF-type ATPase
MGIPPEAMKPNQTVEIVHDGFFALVNVNKLGPGDHLITIIGTGGTYLNAAMIVLNVLI